MKHIFAYLLPLSLCLMACATSNDTNTENQSSATQADTTDLPHQDNDQITIYFDGAKLNDQIISISGRVDMNKDFFIINGMELFLVKEYETTNNSTIMWGVTDTNQWIGIEVYDEGKVFLIGDEKIELIVKDVKI